MTRALLAQVPTTVGTVVDIGCGDGSYLLDLCTAVPGAHGIGFELDASTVDAGNAAARARGLADRIEIRQGRLATDVPDVDDLDGPFCFVTAFVFQELLEQTGRASVVALLRHSFDRHPDAHWIVVEVDHRPDDPAVMEHPLGLAYYNAYYLLHVITEQRLETVEFWFELFAEAGVRVLAVERPDPNIDSLGLKVGFLLGRPGEAT
jgi:2-ketoarginine methyltransferase